MTANVTFIPPMAWTTQQEKIKRREELADQMLQNNLGEGRGYTSPLQVLGQLAQAFAAKRMQSKADDESDTLNKQIMSTYQGGLSDFYRDSHSMTPQQLVEKYQSNPMLAEALKPYQEAMSSALRNREELKQFGPDGPLERAGDIMGIMPPNNLNNMVLHDQNGNAILNTVKIGGDLAAQGLPTEQPIPRSMADPSGAIAALMARQNGNVQAAGPGATQGGSVGALPQPTPSAPPPQAASSPQIGPTATGPNGQKIHFNIQTGQWEPLPQEGGPTLNALGNF